MVQQGNFHVSVAVRIRPVLSHDRIRKVVVVPLREKSSQTNNNQKKRHRVRVLDPDKTHPGRKQEIDYLRLDYVREREYDFDQVFGPSHDTKFVFEEAVKPIVKHVLDGQNVTIFAYGQTGSGKTYTMLGHDRETGVMRLTLEHLFSCLNENIPKTNLPNIKCHLSFVELYNEDLRDLLSENKLCAPLELREDPIRGPVIFGATQVPVKDVDAVVDLLRSGNDRRSQEPTSANEQSSRSHAVLQIVCVLNDNEDEHFEKYDAEDPDHNDDYQLDTKKLQHEKFILQRTSKLSIIDLAGSERAADTNNRGIRLTEGARINRSLLALGNVINALRANQHGAKQYVNFRDSKLTRLLKDSLGGNCRTLMLAHASPAMSSYEETLNTLKYAHRTRAIKNTVRENVYRRPSLPKVVKNKKQHITHQQQHQKQKEMDQLPTLTIKSLPQKPLPHEYQYRNALGRTRDQVLGQVREAVELRSKFDKLRLELNQEQPQNDPFSYISKTLLPKTKMYRHYGNEPQRIHAKAQRECEALKRAVKRNIPQQREQELLDHLNNIQDEFSNDLLSSSEKQEIFIDAEMHIVGHELERLEHLETKRHVDPRGNSIHEYALEKLQSQIGLRNNIIRKLLREFELRKNNPADRSTILNDLLSSSFIYDAMRNAKLQQNSFSPPSSNDFGVQWRPLSPPKHNQQSKAIAEVTRENKERPIKLNHQHTLKKLPSSYKKADLSPYYPKNQLYHHQQTQQRRRGRRHSSSINGDLPPPQPLRWRR